MSSTDAARTVGLPLSGDKKRLSSGFRILPGDNSRERQTLQLDVVSGRNTGGTGVEIVRALVLFSSDTGANLIGREFRRAGKTVALI
jgi:hypothetical protein